MRLTSLFTRDEAVSPVIGVILMVAITVILAAVIGTFVLGLGAGVSSTAPSASFEFEYHSSGNGNCDLRDNDAAGYVEIIHASGDEVPANQVTVSDGGSSPNWDSCTSTPVTDISAGNSASANVDSEDTVRILWANDDDSATLSVWNGPDA